MGFFLFLKSRSNIFKFHYFIRRDQEKNYTKKIIK